MDRALLSVLLVGAGLLGGCAPSPGLVADPATDGAGLWLQGEVDGSHALLTVQGRQIGSAFGLSFHVRIDDALIAVVAPTQQPVLGEGALLIERVDGGDVAFGGTRPSRDAGDVEVADGVIATLEVRARAGATSRVELEDAVARDLDGSFVPLAAAGGTLTLEAP
ncbi:MAG: hypothetical protein HYS27_16560 [Deltaproteobacteria bacterium]|nr:hypothetical protein [Deltaproteobacteria bacterium]